MKKPQLIPSIVGTAQGPISLVIASIGNPGRSFARTRHSAGHMVLAGLKEYLAATSSGASSSKVSGGVVTTFANYPGITLMESGTYMNTSDRAILPMLKWHDKNCAQGAARRLLVLHDELDLPLGESPFKAPSKAKNGHNGLKAIASRYPDPFARVRIGIGRPDSKESDVVAKYVLGKFTPSEIQTLESYTIPKTAEIVQQLIDANVLI